jgi:isopentenyl-diphosphate delta-isomerase
MQDYVILCDEQGNRLGTAPKSEIHTDHTPLHLAFSIFLFRSNGDLLLQQRSHKKKTWPLMWANSCCGHQKLEETLEQTALNRVAFELGITEASLQVMLPDFRYRCERDGIVENEICPVLVGTTTQEPQTNPDEAEMYRWISWEDWLQEIKTNPEPYAYWCIKETEELLSKDVFIKLLSKFNKES